MKTYGEEMIGIIDVGGGLRGNYVSGIIDYLLDNSVDIDYCLGVSAGSANLVTYIAGQRGRLKSFYEEYSFEKQYMGIGNYFSKGMYINLDYIYSDITNSYGKNPLNFYAVTKSSKKLVVAVTDAYTGKQKYFDKSDLEYDNFTLLKASSALPIATRRPVLFKNGRYFDGGISDPIPYKKAFDDGCEKLIICLTLPVSYKKSAFPKRLVNSLLFKYPQIAKAVTMSHIKYQNRINEILELEKQGKVLILYPEDCCGIKTATRNKAGLSKLYELGYEDAKKIGDFLNL
ncbi:MAG: patatin family protein [Clostridia bacterium]|nr:patatin family protein [Clostridia bacterium]